MAKSKSVQDFNIRHRLVGAIVLLGLGVIIIPMFLQGNGPGVGKKSGSLTRDVQEWIVGTEDADTFVTRVDPVGETSPDGIVQPQQANANSTPQLAVIEESFPQVQETQPVVPAPEPEPVPEPVAAAVPKPQPVEPPAPAPKQVEQTAGLKAENVSRGWVVQVGTFSKPENAQNLITRLNKVGFESRYEVVTTDAGQATRVWVGPYEKRVTAGNALNTVKDKTGVKGFIKSFP